ncbi:MULTISPECIES: DUF2919 domain-containing protein [Shewanella]|uniref:DUF2919 domain-containing protein n=1 Tax=Shewanella TaxID=22 RepID=UPI000C3A446B|nr:MULTISPECIES: DUF2919 domain-containing protein [Shewanella]NCQ44949.1 DUF2919 domain-containing protein [Shewanella frigidimarina]NCO71205.1 DUF2919 domain-containing protein [Shewanella vesiculosa]NCP37509.1 DUF2919 domain-containing protein [Shewanella vesiculosa]NCP70831.1 DUF2919 domain-containing protein [Shewanella vesiculosa]NCP74825.1 DUF2919 domain-containing protein [Shewanella vesiculosa]
MNFSNITWLDDRGHIKPPLFLYLILVFLARGWCIFIASLTQFNDRAGLVRLFYPEKSDFVLALIAGVGAVLLYGLIIAERKRSWPILIPLFKNSGWFLWALLILDGIFLFQRMMHDDFLFKIGYSIDALFLFWSVIYVLKSKRLYYYFADWTEDETEVQVATSSTDESKQDTK